METVKLDGKISWTVAVACACMNFLFLIPTKLGGLFFVEILDRYHVSRNIAGYPVFIITLVRCSAGPFVGYFAERFGVNEVLILGSMLGSLGVSACFFADDIVAVIILLGIVHGFGLASNNTLIPLFIKACFKKRMTLAYGVTQAGSSFGAFLASPLILLIFQSYGTSGGFLITGAILLNCLPIVMILKILAPNKHAGKSDDSPKIECTEGHLETGISTTETTSEDKVNDGTNNVSNKTENYVKGREENVSSQMKNSLEKKVSTNLALDNPKQFHSKISGNKINPLGELILSGAFLKQSEKNNCCVTENELAENSVVISEIKTKNDVPKMEAKVVDEKMVIELENNFKEESISLKDKQAKLVKNKWEENMQHSNDYIPKSKYKSTAEMSDKNRPDYQVRYVQDTHPTKYRDSEAPPCVLVSYLSASTYLVNGEKTPRQATTENDEIFPPNFNTVNAGCLEYKKSINLKYSRTEVFETDKRSRLRPPEVCCKTAKKSLMVFLDVAYWIVMITNGFYICALVMFWATMIDFSRDKNIDRSKEVYLLMILPISELIGRLCLGWITDGNFLSRINFCILCYIGMGGCCSLMAMAQELFVVLISIFAFGIFSSGLIVMLPLMIFQFFDSDKQTMVQASRYCLYGPLSFMNGPLIGYFRGTLGSYAWLYHTLAMVSVSCAALTALIPVLARMRDEKKKKNES